MDRDALTLARRYAGGDSGAAVQVDRWIRAAAASFRARLGDDWDDAVQEARIEVSRLLRDGAFRGESALVSYVWRVTVRCCIHAARRRRARAEREAPLAWSEADSAPGPLEAALGLERGRLLASLVAAMPPECLALWRKILAGLGYRVIGEELGVSEGAVRVRALRCRKRALELRA